MSRNYFSWKRVIFILLFGIGIWILIPKIIGFREILNLLQRIEYWAFFVAIFAESFFYIGSTILNRTVLRMTNDILSFYDILKISIMDSFAIQFLPVGSFGVGAVDYYFYRAKNIRITHIILLFVSRTIIVWLIFALIYLVGVAAAPANSGVSKQNLLIVWIIYFMGLGILFYFIYLYFKKDQLTKRAYYFINLINRLGKLFHFNQIPLSNVDILIEKFYQAIDILSKNRRLQFSAIVGALFYWAGDIFCLYFSFWGFGYSPNLAVVIFAYSIAKILGTLSFIPGGLGVVEASLSLIFIGFGVPSSVALAAVLIFRFISFWLPIPIGFWSFLSLNKNYIKMKLRDFNLSGGE